MSTITDMLAAENAASLPRDLVPRPVEPFGYSRDLSCTSDFTANFDEVDPNSREGIQEHLFRMLTTDKDSIPDAPGQGYNLRKIINKGMTRGELRAQEGIIQGEAVRDDRISKVRVELSINLQTRDNPIKVKIFVTPEDPAVQPFDFVFAIADSGEAMLEALA